MIRSCLQDAVQRDLTKRESSIYLYEFPHKDLSYRSIQIHIQKGCWAKMEIYFQNGTVQKTCFILEENGKGSIHPALLYELILQKNLIPLLKGLLHVAVYSIYLLYIFRLPHHISLVTWIQQILWIWGFHIFMVYGILYQI